jgi:beta-lactamase regulating signal transducer with metallopeptidase domain
MSTLVRHFGWGLLVTPPASTAPLENVLQPNYKGSTEIALAESAHTRLSTFEKSAAPAVPSAPEAIRIPWLAILISGWIGATTILLTRLLVTFALGVRLLRQAEPVQRSDIQQGMSLAKAELGVDPPVRILWAEKVGTPLIWCWARQPVLLVPRATARTGDKLDWTSVVCHELAHYKSRDHIAGLLAELAVCIFPWNVLLWLAKRRLVRLSEQACDDWVLASGREADDYAESLLDLLPQRLMAFAPAVVSSKNGLAGRIRRILQEKCPNPRTGVLWALAVTIIAASLAVTAAFAQSRPAKESDSPLIKCSGKVVDQYGQPLVGAKVAAYRIVSDGIAGNIELIEIGHAITKSDGEFAFETEPKPERHTVIWRAVVVAEKEGLGLDWANWPLSEDRSVTIELGNATKLAGVVVDKDATPVAGAQVQAALFKKGTPTQEQTEWLPGIAPLQLLAVKTDNKGRFELDNIPTEASADLLLTAPGLATTYTRKPENIRSGYEGAAFQAGRTDIKIMMPPEARIEGKIVERETDIGVPHVTLAVVPHFTPTFFERFMCVSKEDGSFSIGGLQSGEYLLRTKPVQGEAPRLNVTVESGKTTSDITFELPTGAAAVLARSSPTRGHKDDAAQTTREDMPTKDKLPVLHKMLEDEAYASCWHNVARLIGYVSNDTNSVGVLLRYFERDEGPKFSSIDSLSGKIWTLVFVGQIGGPVADSVLRQALTDEGAARLAKAWIDGQLVPNTPFWGDRNSVITYIRSCAANGLVLSRNQENIDIVKRLYADCKTGKENDRLLEQYMVESLAIHDFITEKGLEAYLGLDVSGTAMLEALDPYLQEYQGESPSSPTPLSPTQPPRPIVEPTETVETSPVPADPEPNQTGPKITFENEIHDLGQVPPGSKNTCEFKFRNTGNAVLKIKSLQPSCACTVAKLSKKEYLPGEAGTITITYSAGKRPSHVAKSTYVETNDATRPRIGLKVKATIVLHVNPEPDELDLLLNRENARCPNITLISIDGEPFTIKSIMASGNWLTAEFDSSAQATKFVLEPKVDMEKLKSKQHGFVKIGVTHPKCKTVQIPYNVLPRFKQSPRSIILRDAKPGELMTKQLSIISNYQEQFEIESVSCPTDVVRVVNEQKADHSITLELEIIPPPIADKIYFQDVLYVNMKDGEQVKVDLHGFYKKDKKTTPARRRR